MELKRGPVRPQLGPAGTDLKLCCDDNDNVSIKYCFKILGLLEHEALNVQAHMTEIQKLFM